VARGLDPLAPPDWPYAHGNRFDDPGEVDGISPEARFRVVYCASERVCAFAETVARFRPNLRALAGIRAASGLLTTLGAALCPIEHALAE